MADEYPDPAGPDDETISPDEIEALLGGASDADDEDPDDDSEEEADPDDDEGDADDSEDDADPDDDSDEDSEEDEEDEKQAKGKKSSAKKPGKDYQDLLAKYGNDPDAMARAVWDNNRERSEAAKETKELKRTVEDLRDAIKDLQQGKTPGEKLPPELAEIASDVKELQEELKEHQTEQREALSDITAQADAIKELNGQIKATPAEKRGPLIARLERLTDQYNQAVRDFQKDKKEGKRILKDLEKKQKQVSAVQESIEQKKQEAAREQDAAKEAQAREGKLFTELVNENFLALDIPKDRQKAVYGDFYDQVSDAVQSELRRGIARGEDKPMDLAALVAEKAMRQARLMGISPKKRQTVGERKIESLKRLGRAGAAQHRAAAPEGDRRPAKKKGDALSKLSVHAQAAFFKKRARGVVDGTIQPRRRPA